MCAYVNFSNDVLSFKKDSLRFFLFLEEGPYSLDIPLSSFTVSHRFFELVFVLLFVLRYSLISLLTLFFFFFISMLFSLYVIVLFFLFLVVEKILEDVCHIEWWLSTFPVSILPFIFSWEKKLDYPPCLASRHQQMTMLLNKKSLSSSSFHHHDG